MILHDHKTSLKIGKYYLIYWKSHDYDPLKALFFVYIVDIIKADTYKLNIPYDIRSCDGYINIHLNMENEWKFIQTDCEFIPYELEEWEFIANTEIL